MKTKGPKTEAGYTRPQLEPSEAGINMVNISKRVYLSASSSVFARQSVVIMFQTSVRGRLLLDY